VNSGVEKEAAVEVWIEDQNGVPVNQVETITAQLPFASEQSYARVWNTGSTYGDSYRVHAVLKEGSARIDEKIMPFAILPEIRIDATCVTERTSYNPNEKVLLSAHVKNEGLNYMVPELTVKIRILDPSGKDLLDEDKKITNLLPGTMSSLSSAWNTGLSSPGNYQALVELFLDGQPIASHNASFRINESVVMTGSISATPAVVFQGNTVQADYSVRNQGNVDARGLRVTVRVGDPLGDRIMESHEETVDVTMNGTRSGRTTFTARGYGLKNYTVQLLCGPPENQKVIATCSFGVVDGTAPVLSVLSPAPNRYFNSRLELAAQAADSGSGVDRVEYQADGGPWRLLPLADPAQARYSTAWIPVPSDEGIRAVSFRATDRAGNTSSPVLVAFTIDLTPPERPAVQTPPDRSTVSSGVLEISGTAEPGSTVEMSFSGISATAQSDPITGRFVFAGVSLMAGPNTFAFNARDRAGNRSLSTDHLVNFMILEGSV
jgi:hypothetical protein